MESFEVRTESRNCLVDITAQVRSAVAGCGVESGIAFIYVPHTTAAVTVNESYDPDVGKDIESTLSKLVPARAGYDHSEGNADAHIKATLVGACAQVLVEDGNLKLGRWQGVFFCEFDGPRTRRVLVKVLKSAE